MILGMKRKNMLLAIIAIVVLLITIGPCCIMYNQVKFDGDRVCSRNPKRFYLNFNLMNKVDSETMTLNQGEILHVSWQIDAGKADVMIAMANETPIYRANKCVKGENADFDVTVPKTGEYTTTISAHHARGWLDVKEKNDKILLRNGLLSQLWPYSRPCGR